MTNYARVKANALAGGVALSDFINALGEASAFGVSHPNPIAREDLMKFCGTNRLAFDIFAAIQADNAEKKLKKMNPYDLYSLYEEAPEPEVTENDGVYRLAASGYAWYLSETEAALLLARLFAALPECLATEAVAVGEMIRRERQ